ncbi:MAG: hypothetical protein LBV04_03915 [Deferribacteraceae bacterium]|nr:hypothetical protein [Deferribacteraceae bacterium]
MLKSMLFILVMLAFVLSCAESSNDDSPSGGFMPADGLAHSAVNDIKAFDNFPAIADTFGYMQASRTFALVVPADNP